MPTVEEKAAFSERLKFALQRSPEKVLGGTQLALHFNLRHHGDQPISPQTAHKWLTGRTIPTPDKLETLAHWLRVDLHWLHYGPPPSVAARTTPKPLPRVFGHVLFLPGRPGALLRREQRAVDHAAVLHHARDGGGQEKGSLIAFHRRRAA
jgi:transcriptional regulator with XRE-family HTH domain